VSIWGTPEDIGNGCDISDLRLIEFNANKAILCIDVNNCVFTDAFNVVFPPFVSVITFIISVMVSFHSTAGSCPRGVFELSTLLLMFRKRVAPMNYSSYSILKT
jgi:hypothetical protein